MGNTVDFGPFRLDLCSGELYEDDVRIVLQDKPFRLLATLVQRRGELILREDLRWALWPDGAFVDFEHGLNTAMKRLRDVLKDSATSPRFIETIPRRGYRFIASVEATAGFASMPPPAYLVGREHDLHVLRQCLARALRGTRQCVFVTGEMGIGKTALVERFLHEARPSMSLCVGEGYALERYSAADAYGPVLEAIRMLALAHSPLVALLGRQAPTWLPHLPSLADRAAPYGSDEVITSATRSRMLREMVATLETAAGHRPLVLVLEDLHWADESTLELVGALARRPSPARLLLVCTYRPADAVGGQYQVHRIKQELKVEGRCVELALSGVDCPAIEAYLELRFPALASPEGFAQALGSRTDGNPLFLINCVDALVSEGKIADVDGASRVLCNAESVRGMLPQSLTELIRLHLERLPADEHMLLEEASVIGVHFTAALLGEVTGTSLIAIEETLERLTRRKGFIERLGVREWPHGTLTGEYRFAHAMYAHVLYEHLATERVASLHRRIGEAIEAQSGPRSSEMATALAVHFDRARLPERAVPYYAIATDTALRRGAHSEASRHVKRALELLDGRPPNVQRDEQEVGLQLRLGAAVSGTDGFRDPRVDAGFSRALELCGRLPDSPHLVPALLGLSRFYGSCGPVSSAIDATRRATEQARRGNDPEMLLEALHHSATAEFFAGEFTSAVRNITEVFGLLKEPGPTHLGYFLSGFDSRHISRLAYVFIHWYLGRPDNATSVAKEALLTIGDVKHLDSRGATLAWIAAFECLAGESADALLHATQAVSLAEAHQDALTYLPFGRIVLGRERCRRGEHEAGAWQIQQGLEEVMPSWMPIGCALYAEALVDMGSWDRGLALVDNALAESTRRGICYHNAELLRLRAESLHCIDEGVHSDAVDASLERGLAIARTQGARWLELRVALSMCRLSRTPDKSTEAIHALANTMSSFATDDGCADLREARTLLSMS